MTSRRANSAAYALIGALAFTLAANGCTPVGLIAHKLIGPPAVEPKYVPEKRLTLVLVERFAAQNQSTVEAEMLSRDIRRELETRQIAPQVDPMGVFDLRLRDPVKFRSMTISQIGAALGAEQVLYVNVLSSSMQLSEGSQLLRGSMSARVKMIDVATGQTMWPTDATEGYPVAVQTPLKYVEEGVSPEAARARLLRQLADSVGKLFYKWKPEEQVDEEVR